MRLLNGQDLPARNCRGDLECGDVTPLSFVSVFAVCVHMSVVGGTKKEKQKKAALHRRTPNSGRSCRDLECGDVTPLSFVSVFGHFSTNTIGEPLSFPSSASSAWERRPGKLCFEASCLAAPFALFDGPISLEAELPRPVFPSRPWEREWSGFGVERGVSILVVSVRLPVVGSTKKGKNKRKRRYIAALLLLRKS
jgi:hypothetical protein